MKKLLKQTVSLVMTAILVSCVAFGCVYAQTDLDALTVSIEALPDYKQFTSVNDQGIDQALADATAIVEKLIELSDDEFYAIENTTKAFDLYSALTILKLREGMPTQIPTQDEVLAQYRWLYDFSETNTDMLDVVMYYTSYPEDDDGTMDNIGVMLHDELMGDAAAAIIRVTATLTTMTEEEQAAVEAEAYSWELEKFPQQFTLENFWDYANDFYSFYLYQEEFTPLLKAEDQEKFQGMVSSFEYLVTDERFQVLGALDEKIKALCDVEGATTASTLSLSLKHEPVCDALWMDICLAGDLYEEDPALFLENYTLYEEYDAVVYPYYDSYAFGDMDYNDEVDAKDALIVLKMTVGKLEMTEDDLWTGDVDGDGDLDAVDALYILKYTVGKIEMFPVEEVIYV